MKLDENEQALFRDHFRDLPRNRNEVRTTCPLCSPDRKKKREKILSVHFEGELALFNCHHCEAKGKVRIGVRRQLTAT